MKRSDLVLLFLLGLVVNLAIAAYQSLPGYMDADYYFAGGLQLIRGNGFYEPYLWNYLADPQALPAPSHAYWLPLASLLASAGMLLTGQATFTAARIGFILAASLVPPITSVLAYRITSERPLSLLSGLLACFSIYYAPFLPVTDNYGIYMLLGASFFLLLSSLLESPKRPFAIFFCIGLISALFSLARSDGLLWLGMSILVAVWYASIKQSSDSTNRYLSRSFFLQLSSFSFFIFLGFLLLIIPWYVRNVTVFGTLMAPGGSRALWLTSYNDTFLYPASQLTMQYWLTSGWSAILLARLTALGTNLLNAFAAQGGIFLFPFIVVGIWHLRRDIRVRFAGLSWVLLLIAMTVVFPFAGPRGAFFHSGAALQPMWWTLAPVGLDALITFARTRNLFDHRAFIIFRASLIGIAILMTGLIFALRVLPNWEREDGHYTAVETLLIQQNIPADAIIIVRNPPGFHAVTNRSAIVIPPGGVPAILTVAEQFSADYLLLEPNGTTAELRELYDHPYQFPIFIYLGESDGSRLYKIIH